MLEIKRIVSLSDISELKKQYFAQSTAPLDGMWHFGFVPMSDHFAFYEGNVLVGYCCKNSEGYLLQFYLSPKANAQAADLFTLIAQQNSSVIGAVSGAFVSTAETDYLSLCFDNSSSFKVNALMYQLGAAQNIKTIEPLDMQLAKQQQLENFVEFAALNIGAPKQWLAGYYSNLIQRNELWGYFNHNELLSAGECRLFDDYQTEYAELGMIVAKTERGKGIATRVLHQLISLSSKQGLLPICSTESGNVGAQKAIAHAGFVSSNRIVQFEFDSK